MRSHAKAIVAISALLLTLALGAASASAAVPVVSIDPAPTFSYTSAHVTGTVDPADQATSFYFQYSADPDNEGWSYGSYQELPAGAGPTTVSDDFDEAHFTALKPGTEYFVRIYAFNESGESFSAEPNPSFTTETVGPPTLSIDPVTTFAGTSAHFSGAIDPEAPAGDPEAFDVKYHFECTPACPGLKAAQPLDADSVSHPVFDDASGLEPNTDYEVSLIASNAAGPVSAGPQSFKTTEVAPGAQTLQAGSIGAGSAILAGNVTPKNSPITYQFEWGTGSGYGNVAPASPLALGSEDNAPHVVTAPVSGLQPGVTYHFRVVATNTNTSEVSVGADQAFTTLEPAGPPAPSCPNAAARSGAAAKLPDCRAYEMVSPLDKNGGDIDRSFLRDANYAASVQGDRVAYVSRVGFGDIESGSAIGQYWSERTSGGWLTHGVTPPLNADVEFGGPQTAKVQAFSADLSKAVVSTGAELTPGANALLNRSWGLYLRNPAENPGTFQLLSKPTEPLSPDENMSRRAFRFNFAGATSDFSHIVVDSNERQLTPGGSPNGPYEWVDGELRFIGIQPGPGEVPFPSTALGWEKPQVEQYYPGDHPISEDGSRIFFSTKEGSVGLYVRENASVTRLISGSEVSGEDPSLPLTGSFQSAKAADGSVAFFTTSIPLTDASGTGDGVNLYRWSAEPDALGHHLTDLTSADAPAASVEGVAATSDDATHVYFVANGDLAAGYSPGPNLYLWTAGGGIRHVATLSSADDSVWSRLRSQSRDARISQSGDQILFASSAQLTGYDTDGHRQVYLYDAPSGRLSCASCNPLASHSSRDADLFMLEGGGVVPYYLPRNLSNDGRRAFFETSERLVNGDTNGKRDVYAYSGGALRLISSGQSGADSIFAGASASGDDVFFLTEERLVGADTDAQVDIYDARVNGGFATPLAPPACEGDSCQPPPAIPNDPTPASSLFAGPGGPTAQRGKKARRACKGRKAPASRKKSARCAKQRKSKAAQRSGRGVRTGANHKHG